MNMFSLSVLFDIKMLKQEEEEEKVIKIARVKLNFKT